MLVFLLAFPIGWAVSTVATPVLAALAHRHGIVDRGDGVLKRQPRPVPYLGGVAVFLAVLPGLLLGGAPGTETIPRLIAFGLATSLGLLDDLVEIGPGRKLLGQMAVAVILVSSGTTIRLTAVHPLVADVAAVFWIVAVANAFNVVDVSDGLCPALAMVASVQLGLWCLGIGDLPEACLCAALAGALLGFLPYNWEPARVYLGDAGSLLVGTMLGALTLSARYSDSNALAPLVTPLGLLAVPLFDLVFVVACRLRLGLPTYRGSPDHFAVRLTRYGARPSRIAAWAMLAGAATGGVSLCLPRLGPRWTIALAMGGMAAAMALATALSRFDPRLPPPRNGTGENGTLPSVADPVCKSSAAPL